MHVCNIGQNLIEKRSIIGLPQVESDPFKTMGKSFNQIILLDITVVFDVMNQDEVLLCVKKKTCRVPWRNHGGIKG